MYGFDKLFKLTFLLYILLSIAAVVNNTSSAVEYGSFDIDVIDVSPKVRAVVVNIGVKL